MANKDLFSSKGNVPSANTVNRAGGKAYSMSSEQALAQYAATGMFNNTYYATAKEQLDQVLKLANSVSPEFLAKVAVYSRQKGYLKDTPALLVAILASKDTTLFKKVFARVIDNGRMLRNFVQIMRSGVTGRTSLGSAPKKVVQEWLRNHTDDQIFKASVGNDPSLADVIKLVHPCPETGTRDHLYAYITGREFSSRHLPKLVRDYEKFKKGTPGKREIPDVPFQMLDSLNLTDKEWKQIAHNANWQMTRMNLNTFKRHGVLEDKKLVDIIASRLADETLVRRSRNFPYQLMQTYRNIQHDMPAKIVKALNEAMEAAILNIPEIEVDGNIYVAVDYSGSMSARVNGGSYSSNAISCNEVAALFASCILRKNPDTKVYRFDTQATGVALDPNDTVFTNMNKLRGLGGGTDCSSVLRELNDKDAKGDVVILLSDNESWADRGYYSSTGLMSEWAKFKKRNPKAKLVCIDLVANEYTQAPDRPGSVLNVGGFSDSVFTVVSSFLSNSNTTWVKVIEETVEL